MDLNAYRTRAERGEVQLGTCAFERLDEIAAVPGIDALTIDPTDLAQDLAGLGGPTQKQVLDQYHGVWWTPRASTARRWRC